jgi:hypothetical protein
MLIDGRTQKASADSKVRPALKAINRALGGPKNKGRPPIVDAVTLASPAFHAGKPNSNFNRG